MIIMFYLILFSLSFSFNDLSLQEGLTPSELSLLNKNAESNSFQNFREPIILDNSINPNEYIIGPGDEFDFNMISSDGSITISLLVSPTGDVLIPNIGNINVDGMILDEARNKIKSALEKNGIVFYSSWLDESMSQTERLDYIIDELGCKMIGIPQMLSDSEQKELIEYGRNKTGRKMPV